MRRLQKNPYARALAIASFSIIALCLLALDLFTKRLFFDDALLRPEARFAFFGGFIQHFLHANLGASFNAPLPVPLLLVASIFFCGWLLLFLFSRSQHWKHPLVITSSGLVFGGALGNMYDRFALGFVRDWILIAHRSIANVADIAILIGCFGLLIYFLALPSRHRAQPMERGGS